MTALCLRDTPPELLPFLPSFPPETLLKCDQRHALVCNLISFTVCSLWESMIG